MIVGELEGAEAGHHVEGAVGPGQRLEVTDAQVRSRGAFGRDVDQIPGGVYAGHVRPTIGGQTDEAARAAFSRRVLPHIHEFYRDWDLPKADPWYVLNGR